MPRPPRRKGQTVLRTEPPPPPRAYCPSRGRRGPACSGGYGSQQIGPMAPWPCRGERQMRPPLHVCPRRPDPIGQLFLEPQLPNQPPRT